MEAVVAEQKARWTCKACGKMFPLEHEGELVRTVASRSMCCPKKTLNGMALGRGFAMNSIRSAVMTLAAAASASAAELPQVTCVTWWSSAAVPV